jgi:DNA invertase Pin-like site-specific DNA recombinase
MKTIAYYRISSNKQDEASQRQIVAQWLESHPTHSFHEAHDAASGALPWQDRALARVLDEARAADTIVVSEISRIARSTVGVLTFLQAAAEKRVNVVAVRSGITLDGSTPSKIVITILAMAAEIERDLLRERTKAALDARKAKGLPVGRQVGALGKRNKLKGKESEIDKLKAAKVSDVAIARLLSVSRGTLAALYAIRAAEKALQATSTEAAAVKQGI